MSRLCSYWARIIIWIAAGVCLVVLGTKLMSGHWSSWKQVMVLDEELEDVVAFSAENPNQWLDFHSSVRLFARANNDGTVELWDAVEGEMLWRRGNAVGATPRLFRVTRPKYVGFRGDILHVASGEKLSAYDLRGNTIREIDLKCDWYALSRNCENVLVVGGRESKSRMVDLNTYRVREFDAGLELSNGLACADVSQDGERILLGDDGLCKVLNVDGGEVIYELAIEDIETATSSALGILDESAEDTAGSAKDLKTIVKRNTARRNSLPTEVRMTEDGRFLVILYGNHEDEHRPSHDLTRIQCVDVDKGEKIWETLRDGRCDGIHFDSQANSFLVRDRLKDGQTLVRYQLDTGTVLEETEFSIVVERPYLKSKVTRLEQDRYFIDPLNERIVFTGKQPWIARLDEKVPVLFPLYLSGVEVPFVAFSDDGRVVATYSAQGTVRVFHLIGREEQGYLFHPLGWLLFFGFTLWATWGAYLIWKWGGDRRDGGMPGWLGGWLGLQCLHVGFVITNVVSSFARAGAERPWEGVSPTTVWLALLVVGVTYFTAFWLVRGAPWARSFHVLAGSLNCLWLMFAALLTLGMFPSFTDQFERLWWGTPVLHDSTAYTVYIALTWAGALGSIFLLLTHECAAWCGVDSCSLRRQLMKKALGDEKKHGVRHAVPM